jgi:hypothetical protein
MPASRVTIEPVIRASSLTMPEILIGLYWLMLLQFETINFIHIGYFIYVKYVLAAQRWIARKTA